MDTTLSRAGIVTARRAEVVLATERRRMERTYPELAGRHASLTNGIRSSFRMVLAGVVGRSWSGCVGGSLS